MKLPKMNESFGWILLNSKLICVIGTVPTYLGIWEKKVNFGNTIAAIQQKQEREKEKVGERNFLFSATPSLKFLLPIPVARVSSWSVSGRKENQMWQWHCRNKKKKIGNCGNAIAENGRKRKNSGCPNHIWGIKKKKSTTSIIFLQHFHNKSQVISYY